MANHILLLPELDQRDQAREPMFLSEIIDEPAWKTIAANISALLYPKKLPPLVLTSTPIAVIDPMAEKRGRASSIISAVVHVVMIAAILWAFMAVKKATIKPIEQVTKIDLPQYMPIAPHVTATGGGGGGGSHDILQTPKGRLPKIEQQPVAAPMVIENNHPKLAAAPSIVMPKDIQLPNSNLPSLGDPRTWVSGQEAASAQASGAAMVRVKAAATVAASTMWGAAFLPRNWCPRRTLSFLTRPAGRISRASAWSL
jgi:protein TonB